MRSFNLTIKRESYARQSARNRCHPASVGLFRYRRRVYVVELGAGDNDSIYAFREGETVYVVTVNHVLPYCGLEAFDLSRFAPDDISPNRLSPKQVGNVFLQESEQVEESLGPKGVDLAPHTIARRLADYCQD